MESPNSRKFFCICFFFSHTLSRLFTKTDWEKNKKTMHWSFTLFKWSFSINFELIKIPLNSLLNLATAHYQYSWWFQTCFISLKPKAILSIIYQGSIFENLILHHKSLCSCYKIHLLIQIFYVQTLAHLEIFFFLSLK